MGRGDGASRLLVTAETMDEPPGAAAWALGLLAGVPVALGWAVAHVEPSWATRYLAAVVGPLLLLVGWGLARTGAVGVTALALAVTLWVQPFTRIETGIVIASEGKSDAKLVAQTLDPLLSADDLVIVAQPEAVPLFVHYLGNGPRFATLWGELDDPSVWTGVEPRSASRRQPPALTCVRSSFRWRKGLESSSSAPGPASAGPTPSGSGSSTAGTPRGASG